VRLACEDGNAVVRISDNGLGIEPEVLPHIFEPFRQAEAGGGKRSRGGLGIGLALVRHLVEKHEGSVQAESGGPGQGTTFTIRLRALKTAVQDGGSPAALQRAAER
jgi:signal transduction histidine kinase